MNPVRAASFTPSSQFQLERVPGWPRLPADLVLDRVVGIGVDSRGFIYVAHRGEHPMLCLHPDGRFCREVGAAVHRSSIAYDLRGPVPIPLATRYWLHGLHVDPWDNVWITDVSRHVVFKFDPAGALATVLGCDGEPGCDEMHFNQPTHVCVVPSGEFFVTDGYGNSRIVKFNANGERVLEWGIRGTAAGEFHTPHVVTLGNDGLLYISDRENDRIQSFDQMGRLQSVWPGLHGVDGLYAAADGFIYGSTGVDHALFRLDRRGRLVDVWVEPEMFTYPHGLAVGADGAIYIADTGDNWVVDPRTAEWPRREYQLVSRVGAEGSAVIKLGLVMNFVV